MKILHKWQAAYRVSLEKKEQRLSMPASERVLMRCRESAHAAGENRGTIPGSNAPVSVPRLPSQKHGILLGIVSVLIWAAYNVSAKWGIERGFRPVDLTLLRYGIPAVLVLPFLVRMGARRLGGLGWRRGLLLASVVGPVFGMLVNVGFMSAPLAHGVVLGPAGSMATGMFLGRRGAAGGTGTAQLLGVLGLFSGVLMIALDSFAESGPGNVWVGDMAFLSSGVLWGLYTYLLKRWNVGAVQAVAAVSLPSLIVFIPIFVWSTGAYLPQVSLEQLAYQAVYQGLLGGFLGVLTYSGAVRALGVTRASMFPAFLPATAAIISVPVLGHWPSTLQLTGVALSTAGLLTSLGAWAAIVKFAFSDKSNK